MENNPYHAPAEAKVRPGWVKLGLWGLPSRAAAWACFWLSVILAAACVGYGFIDRRFFAGAGFLLAAWWYWLSIRWVDQHDDWR